MKLRLKTKQSQMKKGFFLLFAVAIMAGTTVKAQQLKIGFFDLETMVTVMPGYAGVDSLLRIYQQDSLAAEYEIYQSEFARLDSTYKADSASGKSKALLDYTLKQRQQVGFNLVYWQQIAQSKLEGKRDQLAGPLAQRVIEAYDKVLARGNYTLVVNPQAIEPYFLNKNKLDNLFIPVAKELKIQLPAQLMLGEEEKRPASPAPVRPAPAKPKQ